MRLRSPIAKQRDDLLEERGGVVEPPVGAFDLRQRVHRRGDGALVLGFARQGERLRQVRARGGEVALRVVRHAERLRHARDRPAVAQLARDGQALLEAIPGLAVLAHHVVELPRREEAAAPVDVPRARARPRERLGHHRRAELEQPAVKPVAFHAVGELQPALRVVGSLPRPRVRRKDVLQLGSDGEQRG